MTDREKRAKEITRVSIKAIEEKHGQIIFNQEDFNVIFQALLSFADEETRDSCDHCGAKVYSGPPDCHRCGAPNCCPQCCKIDRLQSRLKEAITLLRKIKDEGEIKKFLNSPSITELGGKK